MKMLETPMLSQAKLLAKIPQKNECAEKNARWNAIMYARSEEGKKKKSRVSNLLPSP